MFWTLLVVGALDGASTFSVPILLAECTKPPIVADLLRRLVPIIVICLTLSLFFQWCLRSWGESLTGWFGNELRVTLFERAERLSIDTLSVYHSGYIASLINQVASSVGTLSSTIVWLLGHLCTVLALFMIFTARESLEMAMVNLGIFVLFVSVGVVLARKIVPLADDKNRTQALVMERFIDLLTNISTVKKLGIISWADRKLRAESVLSDASIFRFQRFHANRWSLLHGIFYTAFIATLALLLRGVGAGTILILFVAGFGRVQNLAERLSELIKSLLETNAYVSKLEEVLSKERTLGERSAGTMRQIECSSIVHRHGDRSQEIVIPSFSLRVGERVVITGASGQGKSTFLSILANHRAPSEGRCLWNGIPYGEFNESLTHSFAVVSQEAELFNLSLRENLTMDTSISDDEVLKLLHDLGLDDLMHSLADGLDTRVGEKGMRLSSGQKQRINIARSLLLKRSILLLDEPTSHLDKGSEELVVGCLKRLPRDVTLVIVSHQGALESLCDRRFVFENGHLTEKM
jgi:ATP-binding cassette subfamily B protein/ATP-binding cassette subfamily C protein/ATP-binding cassette subfamily C protein LapB